MAEVEGLYGPTRMDELAFLALLLRLMDGIQTEARQVDLYDLQIDIVLPGGRL